MLKFLHGTTDAKNSYLSLIGNANFAKSKEKKLKDGAVKIILELNISVGK